MSDEGSGVKCLGLGLSLWVFTGRAHSLFFHPDVCACVEKECIPASCVYMQTKDSTSCFIRLVYCDQTVKVGRHTLMYAHIILPDKKATFSLRMGSTSIALISSFLLKPAQRQREEEKDNVFNGRIKKTYSRFFSHSISCDFFIFFFFLRRLFRTQS